MYDPENVDTKKIPVVFEDTEAKTEPAKPSKIRKVAIRLGATVAATTAALTLAGGKAYSGDSLLLPKVGIEYIVRDEAPSLSPAELAKIDAIMDRPENPVLATVEKNANDEEYYQFDRQLAEKYGLLLADMPPVYLEELEASETLEETLIVANRITSQFGIEVSVPHGAGFEDITGDITTIDRDGVNLDKLKRVLEDVTESFRYIPLELAPHLSLDEIKVVASIEPVFAAVNNPAGLSNTGNDIIYIKFDAAASIMDVVWHEIGHQLDQHISGRYGMNHDPSFSALNRPGFEYGDNPSIDIFMESEKGTLGFISDYAQSSVMEDKAEYFSIILGNGWNAPVYTNPILRSKITYLLGRLERLAPGIASFYDAMSHKPPRHGGPSLGVAAL